MANKRIKDLETLADMDGVNDYLVVDDADGNTSKMAVDDVVRNSGPFSSVTELGPPRIINYTFVGYDNNAYIEADIFDYESAVYGRILLPDGPVAFNKSANSNSMTTISEKTRHDNPSYNAATKTIDVVGNTYNHNKGLSMIEGVAKSTNHGYINRDQAAARIHVAGGKYGLQFGTGGLSVWGDGENFNSTPTSKLIAYLFMMVWA